MPFEEGKSGNEAGRPASAYQSFAARARKWLEEYTVQQILEIATDKKQINALPAIDYMVVMRISEAFRKGGQKSMDMLLDRVLGKPKVILLHGGAGDEPPINFKHVPVTPEEAFQLYRAARDMIAQEMQPDPDPPAQLPPPEADSENA